MKHGLTTMTRKRSNNQVNGKKKLSSAKKSKSDKIFRKNMFINLKHPPYSLDLAPMDIAVFPYIKSFLRGMRFDNLSELRQAVMNVIFHMKTDQFVQIFDDWVR